jgi:hypothetical protein
VKCVFFSGFVGTPHIALITRKNIIYNQPTATAFWQALSSGNVFLSIPEHLFIFGINVVR